MPKIDYPDPSKYAFDAYHATVINENHVNMNGDNVNWVIAEVKRSEPDLTTVPALVNNLNEVKYNFSSPFQRMIPNATVNTGGKLQINGFYGYSYNNKTIDNTPFFIAYTRNCRSYIKVDGGDFVIGDDMPLGNNNKAEVYIKKGSVLELKNGATLAVHNGCKLIIEYGAALILESGCKIDLKTSTSVIEIQGLLQMENGAEYKTTGEGYTSFVRVGNQNPMVNTQSNGKLTFEGTNGEKRLELGQNTTLEIPATIEFKMTFASAYVQPGTMIQPHGKVILDYSSINGPSLSTTLSHGILLEDQSDVDLNVEGCTFTKLETALDMSNNPYLTNKEFKSCTFTDCGEAITISNCGVTLSNCDFSNCTKGLGAVGMVNPSAILSSSFTNCATGAEFYGNSPNSTLLVSWSSFTNSPIDIFSDASSPMVTFRCSNFTNSYILTDHVNLNMSKIVASSYPVSSAQFAGYYHGGKNVMTNSTIQFDDGWNWHLKYGNNDFIKANGWTGMHATGKIDNPNVTSTIEVDGNNLNANSWASMQHKINAGWVPTNWTGLPNPNMVYMPYGGCSGWGGDDGDGLAPPPMTNQEDIVSPTIEMSMFPNPAKDEATILLSLPEALLGTISITDITGRVVFNMANPNLKKGK